VRDRRFSETFAPKLVSLCPQCSTFQNDEKNISTVKIKELKYFYSTIFLVFFALCYMNKNDKTTATGAGMASYEKKIVCISTRITKKWYLIFAKVFTKESYHFGRYNL